ncbi:hypothetical protein QF027_008074 [Streptomyces canus]|nr:hypothetical protein [Streptomyces canus]
MAERRARSAAQRPIVTSDHIWDSEFSLYL